MIGSKAIIIAVVAVVAVAGIGAGVFFMLNDNDDTDKVGVGTVLTYELEGSPEYKAYYSIIGDKDTKWKIMLYLVEQETPGSPKSIETFKSMLESHDTTFNPEKKDIIYYDGTTISGYEATYKVGGTEYIAIVDAKEINNITRVYLDVQMLSDNEVSGVYYNKELQECANVDCYSGEVTKTNPFLFIDDSVFEEGKDPFVKISVEDVNVNEKYGTKSLAKYQKESGEDDFVYVDESTKITYKVETDGHVYTLVNIKF